VRNERDPSAEVVAAHRADQNFTTHVAKQYVPVTVSGVGTGQGVQARIVS